MPDGVNLLDLFQTVAGSLKGQQSALNKADSYNHDHGDHMVEIFEVITQAMKEKQNADAADQLEYAAKLLRSKSQSGSAQMYAQGLNAAAKKVTGKNISVDNALSLLQTLLNGGGEAKAPSSDVIGSLLSGLGDGGDGGGLDASDLLGAGMAFLNAKQGGGSNLEALAKAFVSTSAMSENDHRAQSGEMVTNAVLQMLMSSLAK